MNETENTSTPNKTDKMSTLQALLIGCSVIAGIFSSISIGAIYGISAYKYFAEFYTDQSQGISGVMFVSFLLGVPACIGILIGYLANRRKKAGLAGTTVLTILSISFFMFAAGAFLREGAICIIMAAPLFIAASLIGALLGMIVVTVKWIRGTKLLSISLLAPLLLAPIENRFDSPSTIQLITSSIYINAKPSVVWHHINYPLNIQPSELQNGFAYKIGVPYPIEARTLDEHVGGLRILHWQRGVNFKEIITAWEPNQYIEWEYIFDVDSFPPGSLDDHIVIGGRYFDLEKTSYTLKSVGEGTELSINVKTRLTTNFNWYASLWSRFLVTDTANAILKFYKKRSENS